jgi:hypothetical protein
MKWYLPLLVFVLILVLPLLVLIYFKIPFKQLDGFGATSPGTMVQLATSHVPTEEDLYYYRHIYPKQVQKEIRNMTESDLIYAI